MNIDPNTHPTAAKSTGTRASAKPTAPRNGRNRRKSRTDASSVQARAAVLAEQVHQLPEILQDRVIALANAVRMGTYQVSPEQTAEAILSDLHTRDGTAA